MKAAVYANGSDKIGMGHIIRTMAIAEMLKLNSVEVEYICTSSSESSLKFVSNKNYNVLHELPSEKRYSFIIVDSYDIKSAEELLNFYKIAEKVIYIDDLNKLCAYDIDILINYSVDAETLNYRGKAIKLLGSKYTPLRRQFSDIVYKEPDKEAQNVLITMGAADEFNYTEYILKKLLQYYPTLNYRVVLGMTNKHKEKIKNMFICSNVEFYMNVENMASLMQNSDIAISAGGSTIYELCTCSIPTIAVITACNQKQFIEAMNEEIALEYMDFTKVAQNEIIDKFNKLYKDYDCRKKLAFAMNSLIDGKGTDRIVEVIMRC